MGNLRIPNYLKRSLFKKMGFMVLSLIFAISIQAQNATIQGTVFGDVTNNGINDGNDDAFTNVTVELRSQGGVTLGTIDANTGEYLFNVPINAPYRLRFVLPTGFQFSAQDVGTDDSIDSDIDASTGLSEIFSNLVDGQIITVDVGIVMTSPTVTCNGPGNLSLDPNTCSNVISPSDGITVSAYPGVDFSVEVRDEANALIANNTVDCSHIGDSVQIAVIFESGSRTGDIACWRKIKIEDKAAPAITCPATAEIECFQNTAIPGTTTLVNTTCPRTAVFNLQGADLLSPLTGASASDCSPITSLTYQDLNPVNIDCSDAANNGSIYMQKFTRIFTAVSSSETFNTSTCSQEIFIKRPVLVDDDVNRTLFWPTAVVNVSCSRTDLNPSATNTDLTYPKYLPIGLAVDPVIIDETSLISGCELRATYVDQEVDFCTVPGVDRRITRTWTVENFASCPTATVYQFTQIINVSPEPLTIEPVGSNGIITLNTAIGRAGSGHSVCLSSTTTNLPTAAVSSLDLCSSLTTDDISISILVDGIYGTTNGGVLSQGLPIGDYPIKYIATGPCGLRGEFDATLRVQDNVAPTALCNSIGPLTLSGSSALISAEQLAGGSYDNCKTSLFKLITRLNADDTFAQPLASNVEVNCSDIGTLVPVLSVVFDLNPADPDNWTGGVVPDITSVDPNGPLSNFKGLWSYCWSTVNVDKATEPRILGCGTPQSFTVTTGKCAPDGPTLLADGSISYPDLPNSISFDPVCDEVLTAIEFTDSFSSRSCNGIVTTSLLSRTITFTYTARDGSSKTLSCVQLITITDNTPVSIVVQDVKDIVGCDGLDIDNLTAQEVYNFILSKSPTAVVVTGDECDDLDVYVAFKHDPFIKSGPMIVTGTILVWPVLSEGVCNNLPTEKIELCFEFTGDGCKLTTPDVTVIVPDCATDGGGLTGEIVEATLNAGQDRDDFDFIWTEEGSVIVLTNNTTEEYTFATKDLEEGKTYTVTVVRKDDASISTVSAPFELPNCCSNPTIAFIIPDNGTSASFILTDGDIADYNWTWYEGTRDAIGDAFESPIQDEPNDPEISGLSEETPFVLILSEIDNPTCQDTSANRTASVARVINGLVTTPSGLPVTNARVALESNLEARVVGAESTMAEAMTDTDGAYEIEISDIDQLERLTLSKGGDDRDQISTLDMLVLARHILGIKEITSPYSYIAADVTGNGSISTADLLEMQRLILGITNQLRTNSSWRFVKEDYVFDDMNTILNYDFPESFDFANMSSDEDLENLNFIAIKVGDLSSAYDSDLLGGNSTPKTLSLQTDNQLLLPGSIIEVPITTDAADGLSGYQHAYQFDTDKLIFTGIEYGDALRINDDNFGFKHLGEGVLTTSWYDTKDVNLDAGTVLYTLRFEVLESGQLQNALTVSSEYTKAEAYFDEHRIGDVQFTFSEVEQDRLTLTNNPNPFTSTSLVMFNAPTSGAAAISISDISGRTVYSNNLAVTKGENQLVINKSDLQGAGIYLLKIDLNGSSATQKIVLID